MSTCLQSIWITTWCSSDIPNKAAKVTSDGHRNPFFQPTIHSGGRQILETPFTNSSDMDDMFLQCNKNAIYVLNSNYAYGEFGRLNLIGTPTNNILTPSQSNHRQKQHQQQQEQQQHHIQQYQQQQQQENFFRNTNRTSQNALENSQRITSTTSIPKFFHCNRNEKQNRQQNFTKSKSTETNTLTTTKKNAAVKSTIIAKKTKFWKCLEEEKWKKNSIENLSTTNCERKSGDKHIKKGDSSNNNLISSSSNNNNSSSNNSNNNNNNSRKSSTELYREAAQLLGLSCTLCDNCRCLDCQSRYFECDDSDTYSELSFSDYYEGLQETLQQQKQTQPKSQPPQKHQQQEETNYENVNSNCPSNLNCTLDACNQSSTAKTDTNNVIYSKNSNENID